MARPPLPTPATERPPATADRWLRLDAVRAAAAIMVLAHHVVASGMWDMAPLSAFAFEGYRGVLVFFVLSGFVIARPFARGTVPTSPFLARRALRIMPAYVVALLGVTLISGDLTFLAHPVQHLLFLQEYDPELSRVFLPPAWTLVIEVSFYALLPFAVLAWRPMRARSDRLAMGALVALGIASLIGHVLWSNGVDQRAAQMLSLSFPAMLWAFVPGVLLAYISVDRPAWTERLASTRWAAAAATLIAIGWMARESAASEVALVMGVGLVIPWLCRPRTTEWRVVRLAAVFGVMASYAFYLWHMAVMQAVARAGIVGAAGFAVTFLAATLIALASFLVVESPAIRASRRIGRRGPAAIESLPVVGQAVTPAGP